MSELYYLIISFALLWLPFVINRYKKVRFHNQNIIVILIAILSIDSIFFLASNILFYDHKPNLIAAKVLYVMSLTVLQTLFVYFIILFRQAYLAKDDAIKKYWLALVFFIINIVLNWIIMGIIFNNYQASDAPSSLVGIWAFALIVPAYLITIMGLGLIVINQVFWVGFYRWVQKKCKRCKELYQDWKYILT